MWQVYLYLANERQHADEMSARQRVASRSRIRRWRLGHPKQVTAQRPQDVTKDH